jgi:hypothetical protein
MVDAVTTIKHPVRTSLLAAAMGLILLTFCSRAHAADSSGAVHGSVKSVFGDIAVSRVEPAANNHF